MVLGCVIKYRQICEFAPNLRIYVIDNLCINNLIGIKMDGANVI